MNKVITSREFGEALCRHFGIPSNQVSNEIAVNTEISEMMSVTLTVFITPADLIGIGEAASATIKR